jgi:predicted ATPase
MQPFPCQRHRTGRASHPRGALTKEGDRWTIGAGLASLEMSPTIDALLAARIERLRPEERGVLERAAVVGRHFSRSAVAALLPPDVTISTRGSRRCAAAS